MREKGCLTIKNETIMKTIFNIEKNVRNSHSISALGALKKLQSLGLVVCALLFGSLQVWGDTWTRVTSISELTGGGTFIMGYEATAKSGVIVPLRSYDCNATTGANGYFHTGTTDASSTSGTIDMSDPGTTTKYEVYISSPTSGKINIQMGTSSGNYYGATSGGTTSNKGRLYTSGNSSETNLTPEWASEENNQFKLTAGVSGDYKYLKYNTGSPRFAFYNSAGEKIVFYKKGAAVPHTVTFNAQGGTCGTASLTEASGGAGVTLPAASPSSACASEGWAFYGWATAAVGSSTPTAPTIVGKAGDTYKPAADIELHAVYATGEYTKITSTGAITSGAKYIIAGEYSGDNYVMTNTTTTDQYGTWLVGAVISEDPTNKYHAAKINAAWLCTITATSDKYYIQNASGGWIDTYYSNWYNYTPQDTYDKYTIDFSAGDGTCTIQNSYGDNPFLTLFTDGTFGPNDDGYALLIYKQTTTPYYCSTPSCCDKAVAVSYNSAGSTHVSAMTFSVDNVATCGGASTRRVTVSVTPTSGYLFKAGDELTWTKSSGTIPAAPTLVSGPTLNAGKYEFVYEFAQNDNGAGTFAAAASTLTNYRTTCCTELGSIGGSVAFTNPTTAVVSWSDLDHVSSWTVKYKTHAAGVWNTAGASSASAGTRSVTISSLTCNTDYDFQIIATPASGYCDASQTIENENSGTWTVTSTITNGTKTSVPTTACGDYTATFAVTSGYHFPDAITVTGASSHTWTKATGTLTISGANITGNITINITCPADACSDWGFYYGTDGQSDWAHECFTKVKPADASDHEWQTAEIALPNKPNWYVDNASEDDGKKKLATWSELYFAVSQGDGTRPMVGTATGATGKVRIYDNWDWNNRAAGFLPTGYVMKFGSNEYPFTFVASNEYRTEIVDLNSTTYANVVSVGIEDGEGDYVSTGNTQEYRHVFFVPSAAWKTGGAKFCIHYWGAGDDRTDYMSAVPGKSGWYEGWLPAAATGFQFERQNPAGGSPSAGNRWTAGENQTLQSNKNCYTMTASGGESDWTGTVATSLYTSKGKFRMWDNSTSKNWYVTFYPHYVLHYDANSGSGAPADQTVALDASPCQLTVSSTVPTRAGYTFLGWNQSSSATSPDGDWDGGDTHAMTADVTLYAVWAANHTLSYNYNGGDGSSCVGGTKYTGESFTACSSAGDKEGHTFTGWLGSNSVSYTAGSSYSIPDADLTLTAQWNPNVYNITYKDQGDAAYSGNKTDGRPTGNPATHTYGSATALVDGVRAGYRFDGWYTNSTCTEGPVTSIGATAKTADFTLYAKWTQIWTISWKIWNNAESRYDEYAGDGTHTTEVVAGGTISKIPTNPADNALSSCASKFMGWSETCLGSDVGQSAPGDLFTTTPVGSITADKTYYAVYASVDDPESWTLTSLSSVTAGVYAILNQNNKAFTTINGSGHGDVTAGAFSFTNNVATSAPSGLCEITIAAVSGGFTMYNSSNGYLYASKAASGNLAWHATESNHWSYTSSNWTYSGNSAFLRSYEVTGAATSGGIRTYGNNSGDGTIKLAKKTPATWKDYVTSCCGTAAVTNGGYSNVTGSGTTMSAKVTWADAANTNRYRVVCTALSIDAITTDKYYTTAGVMTSCTDYTFNVYAAPSGGCQSAPLEITVSPVEAAKTVTFNYNGSGQSDGSFTTDCTHSSTNLPTPDAYAGHRFDGWYDASSGGTKIGVAGDSYAPTATITLYAHWIAVANLTYSGDVTSTCTGTTSKDVGTTITACTPSSRDHYTFDYWVRSDNSAHVNAGATFTMPGSDLTLTAHWTADSYSITYKDQGDVAYSGSNSASLPASHSYGTATVLVDGVKSGYRFDGWFTTSACTGDPITSLGATAYTSAITLYAKWTASYTFTFSKNGVVDDELTRGQIGGGNLVMPNTTVDCGLWTTFEGWVESDVAQTTTEPANIYKPGDIYVVGSSDKEFKALYSKHEGDATVYYEKVTSGPKSGEYIIVSEAVSAVYYTIDAWSASSYYTVAAVTMSANGTVSGANATSASAKTFTVHTGHNGTYANKFAIYDGAYYLQSGTSISRQDAQSYTWELLDGNTDVNSKGTPYPSAGSIHSTSSTNYDLELNSGANPRRVNMYANTQKEVFLYRKKVAGTTYYTTAPASCAVPTYITVSYDDNKAHAGGQTITGMPSGAVLSFTSYPYFASYTVGSAPVSPTGYHFTGWNTSADGNGDSYTAGQTGVTTFGYTESITLFAQWERVYTVTLYDNGVERTTLTQASAGATVNLPDGNNCGGVSPFTFEGWTESAVELTADPVRPATATLHAVGAWEPTSDITLYSVYSRSVAGCEDFAAGVSGAYTVMRASYYAQTTGADNQFDVATTTTNVAVFYIAYSAAKNGYTIRTKDGFVGWNHDGSDITRTATKPYYWDISGSSVNGWKFKPQGVSNKYLSLSTSGKFKMYGTDYGYNTLTSSVMTYYYNTALCGDAQINFKVHDGATISGTPTTPDGASWNGTTHVLSGLENCDKITTFPTATYDGWIFVGWSTEDYTRSGKHTEGTSQYAAENASTDDPDASIIYKTDGNPYVVRGGSIDLYPVFTRFPENEPFDLEAGGTYYMYYLDPGSDDGYGAPARRYAGEWDGLKRYEATTTCATATEFEFTKVGDVWHIKNTANNKWLGGTNLDDWLIENNDLGTLTDWTITIRSGNQFNASCQSGRQIIVYDNFFMDYSSSNLGSNPGYHCVYLGSCEERIFSSEPNPKPTIDLTGEPIITSSVGQRVRATEPMVLSGSHLAGATKITLSGTNLTFATSATATPAANLEVTVTSGSVAATNIYVYYTPGGGDTSDGVESIIVTATDNGTVPATAKASVSVRHLPADFVIAAKLGDKWYALPNTCNSYGSSTTGVVIEVDDANDPTAATAAPDNTKWGLRQTKQPARITAGYADHLTFTERGTTATADNQQALYNYNSADVYTYGQWTNYAVTNPDRYEWIPVTTDFKDYTLTNAHSSRPLILRNDGDFKAQTTNQAYDGKVRLLPATFYTEAEMQVIEWKASSVVVMYTGSGETATTKVGSSSEGSAQTLTAKKIDHGVFELTTAQALTSNYNKQLVITIRNSSSGVVGKKTFVIPYIVGSNQTAPMGLSSDVASTTDVVILDNYTLSAATTKYTFKNITVYPGGKLVIGSGKQLGMASLTLRGGSSWGAAEYEYKYPQFVLNNAADGAYSNSAAGINYEYVTTKDQYYTFVLPYDANTKNIKYPVDIYGDAVAADNKGSFEFQYYDGAARAAGGGGWATLAEDPTEGAALVAGRGYTFLGMPKKVDAYDGTDDSHASSRQRYGIHRIPMSVAAATVQSGENNVAPGKSIPISVTLADKNNASGRVLVGNPYLSNVGNLDNADIQVGQLVHTSTVPWDGKWEWDDTNPSTGVRYVVIPNNSGTDYNSEMASDVTLPAFKNFFVQISNGSATSLVIPASKRKEKALIRALLAESPEKDIRLAVDLVSAVRSDKVDLLINDNYSAEFDQDGDFTKMMNGSSLNIYGVYPDDKLSFIAVDKTTASQSIAIGYQVPEGGDYILRLSDRDYVMADAVEALYVTDHEMSPEITTNLLEEEYAFQVNQAETNDTRFTIRIVMKEGNQGTLTGLDDVDVNSDAPQKFLYRDKVYIWRGGQIYDTTGKMVQINK